MQGTLGQNFDEVATLGRGTAHVGDWPGGGSGGLTRTGEHGISRCLAGESLRSGGHGQGRWSNRANGHARSLDTPTVGAELEPGAGTGDGDVHLVARDEAVVEGA